MAIELHPVFLWDCDECGSENIVRAPSEVKPDEAHARYLYIPSEVKCRNCRCLFTVRTEEDSDD